MNSPFSTIALIGKHKNPEIAVPLLHLAEYLTQKGYTVFLDHLTVSQVDTDQYPSLSLEQIGEQSDLAVVIGGDGTL